MKERLFDMTLFGVVGILFADFFLIFALKIYDITAITFIISFAFGAGASIGWIRTNRKDTDLHGSYM